MTRSISGMLKTGKASSDVVRCVRAGLLVVCLAAAGALTLFAQITSTIQGTVTDPGGLPVSGANIRVLSPELGIDRSTPSDQNGHFEVPGLPAGIYRVEVAKTGFETALVERLELTVNRTETVPVSLAVASVKSQVVVTSAAPLLETATSSTGTTITPRQIEDMPLNGRNYLDLMQLVAGVTVNRQADQGTDAAVPVLGQRGNNTLFLIDGMPNSDDVNGGPASQFNQDSILEFQVLTSGYKAEFGYGSGGIVNVITKSGTNNWHGLSSVFFRTYKLDSSDIAGQSSAPFLRRWDPDFEIGGPLVKDKVFLFTSFERIMESRSLNFQFPAFTPPVLIGLETPYDRNTLTNDTRVRAKLDENLGVNRFTEQMNYTNTHVNDFLPLSAATNLPSTRYNLGSSHLLVGFSDIATLGNQSNPWLLNYYVQFRSEPSSKVATYPQAGLANTTDNLFSSLTTGDLFGDLGQVSYGAGFSPLLLDQKYGSAGANIARVIGSHTFKLGWDFMYTHVDGTESTNYFNQLFGLQNDLLTYGPVDSGVYYLNVQGGATPQGNNIRLRDYYDGLYLQDDWKIRKNLTLNLGIRWDYDSEFPNATNISPRLGAAWQPFKNTVVRASFGRFYDHFRLGLARDVPGLGGANVTRNLYLSFPRLFYGNPSIITQYFNELGRGTVCVSSYQTDAQIASSGSTCLNPSSPLYGINHLNSVVAPGHAPIPAGAPVNINNVQSLTGYTPTQFADAASAAVGETPGYFTYDPFGNLSINRVFQAYNIPITIDPSFSTPYTDTSHVGIQQQLSNSLVLTADYYHENIDNILGVRETNLAFISRIPGNGVTYDPGTGNHLIFGYGPWYTGTYNGVTVQLTKRMSKHFQVEVNYTYAREFDNMLNSSLISDVQTGMGAAYTALNGPTDNFVGIVPLVTDPTTGQTNASHSFVTSTGNPVPKAGTYYNGANIDYGPSDLSVPNIFRTHGIWQLPLGFELSGIFTAQSGFAYTRGSDNPPDVDGDGLYNGRDITYERNGFRAPAFIDLDIRAAKTFTISERFKLHAYFEMFNLFNRANPAAMETLPGQPVPFGEPLQVLPGREGQLGLRVDF